MKALCLVACQNSSAPSTTPSASASVIVPPPIAAKSGERLKLRSQRGDDGSIFPHEARFDTKFNEACMVSCASDGKQHCLPNRAKVLDSFFVDKDCTQRMASVPRGQPQPAHARLASKDPMTGTTYPCEFETQVRVFKVESEYRESYIFSKDASSGACTKVTDATDSSLAEFIKHHLMLSVSSEISPSEFVTVTSRSDADIEAAPAPTAATSAMAR